MALLDVVTNAVISRMIHVNIAVAVVGFINEIIMNTINQPILNRESADLLLFEEPSFHYSENLPLYSS